MSRDGYMNQDIGEYKLEQFSWMSRDGYMNQDTGEYKLEQCGQMSTRRISIPELRK